MRKWRVFVSYAHADAMELAHKVRDSLQDLYWADVFADTSSISEAGNITDYVLKIDHCDELVVVCTEHSRHSWWVGFECGLALKSLGRKHIWPVRGDASSSFDQFIMSLQLGSRLCSDVELDEYLVGLVTNINRNIRKYLKTSFRAIKLDGEVAVADEFPGEVTRLSSNVKWTSENDMWSGQRLKVVRKDSRMILKLAGSSANWPIEWLDIV